MVTVGVSGAKEAQVGGRNVAVWVCPLYHLQGKCARMPKCVDQLHSFGNVIQTMGFVVHKGTAGGQGLLRP